MPTIDEVTIDYTNYRDERGKRTIRPREIIFAATEWHPLGWMLKAWDVEKRDYRLFAMEDIHSWEPCLDHPQEIEADEAESLHRVMCWEKAEEVEIEDKAYYLVQTNGGQWRDFHLIVARGYMVKYWLRPEIVRGRPMWIARISRPPIP